MYTKNPKTVYLRKDTGVYYMNLRNRITGEVIRKSAKTDNYEDAVRLYEKEQQKLDGLCSSAKLCDVMATYMDESSPNPRRRQAMMDGKSYGDTHAENTARHARQLGQLLERRAPKIYQMEMADITVLHIKTIKELIIKEWGHCRKSQQIFTDLKTYFSQAHEEGIIFASPCVGLSDIQYKVSVRDAMPVELLQLILGERGYMNHKMWSFIAIAITTGMRKSEIIALHKDQILDGGKALLIDRAVKDKHRTIGPTKTDERRILPLSKIAQSIILDIVPSIDGQLFADISWDNYANKYNRDVRKFLKMKYPELSNVWTAMTCHVFRHSLYSNLICNGANQTLAETYLSWTKQNLDAMPANYLHIYARNLTPIADLIDEMYTPVESKKRFPRYATM